MTRRENDYYPTPPAAVDELLRELTPLRPGYVCDPAAGDGALLRVALDAGLDVLGYEINGKLALDADMHIDPERGGVILDDYLKVDRSVHPAPALFLSNPPYSLAQEFITKMLLERGADTIVAVLLRLNFLGSQRRHSWWKATGAPSALRVVSKRPSFTGNGKTDMTEYAWYIWDPPGRHLGLKPLDWYRGCE